MCGIAAVFGYSAAASPVDRAELLRVREAMLNRGPDGAGLWISDDRRVGLAHRRLSIIDLTETGAQPMVTADGAVRIVFNGEIYNYRELRARLEARGRRFHSQSDTEVLLHLYQEHGRDMFKHLRGMFAFALWDERKRGLLLARDPYGIKPLYYSDNGSALRVASQVKALLKGGAIDTAPEPAGHAGFHLWGHVPEPYTLYKGIRALPAGTSLWMDASGRRDMRKFFDLAAELAKAGRTPLAITPEDRHVRLRAALADSVRRHLVADVPVGIFLSAGIDSTTLVALAKEVGAPGLHTVTLGFREFQGTLNDEVPLAEQAAREYGTIHHTSWVTEKDFRDEYSRLLDSMDQPSIDGVNSYFVSKAAKEAGLKVVLSGLGGDELFSGYSDFRDIPRMVGALGVFSSAPAVGRLARLVSAPVLKRFTSHKYAGLLEYGGDYGGAYLLRRALNMPWSLTDVMDRDMARDGLRELATMPRLSQATLGIENPKLKVCALESAWYMRNQLLRDTDWASMAHSLEIRVPLVDIELLAAVAPLYNSAAVPTKHDLAQAPVACLPGKILERKKTGFSIPVREWLMRGGSPRERGLKSWARLLYTAFCPAPESPRIRVVHFQRRPLTGQYSLERLFADVRAALSDRIDVKIWQSRHGSIGVWRRLYSVFEAAVAQGEVNHVTGDVHFLTYLMDRKRTVLTIADCVTLERLRGLKRRVFWFFWYWLPVQRCRAITVISESTKRELLRYVACDPDSVHVIHCCISDDFQAVPAEFNREYPRLLHIGTGQNKNLERVAEALEGIPCRLAIIGKLSQSQRDALGRHRIDWENLVGLGEQALLEQYHKSDMVVFASTYEGFGLPIAEANAVGRPVVTSTLYSMPEVAGDAACLVDPYKTESIREGILRVISDSDYRDALIKNGYRNVERFRPAVIAAHYSDLYRRIHRENKGPVEMAAKG